MLSRDDFEESCKALIDKYAQSNDSVYGGWSWNEHAYVPRLGYLARKRTVQALAKSLTVAEDVEDSVDEAEVDAATAVTSAEDKSLEICEYIVYSATFQVPAYYFSVHTRSGSPLSLNGILESTLFRRNALAHAQKTEFAVQAPEHAFPLLSQGEHPTLSTPCWFFHPCETPTALSELVQADETATCSPARLLELWILLVGNVVDLRA